MYHNYICATVSEGNDAISDGTDNDCAAIGVGDLVMLTLPKSGHEEGTIGIVTKKFKSTSLGWFLEIEVEVNSETVAIRGVHAHVAVPFVL